MPDDATRPPPAQALLVATLARILAGGDGGQVVMHETHLSWVLLAGGYAYKIKKAIDVGFADFRTLDQRHAACMEELRLNRRLAPRLYLDVVAITGTPDAPQLGGAGRPVEYAVRMHRFADDALLSDLLARGALTGADMDALAARIAAVHAHAAAATEQRHGAPATVLAAALANFRTLAPIVPPSERGRLDALEQWTRREHARRRDLLSARRASGFVRECHGDLHLANVVRDAGELIVFDCIEFDPALRFIDVLADIAFTVMDLAAHRRPDLGARLLSAYLEATGDYAGVPVLRIYLVYRALVRAKVAALRACAAAPGSEREASAARRRNYLGVAERYARAARPGTVLMHGLSGSGKSTLAQSLLEHLQAIRIRSDVERKRLAGLDANERSGSPVDGGLYTAVRSEHVYRHLLESSGPITEGGFPAIVDATFLRDAQRAAFLRRARATHAPLVIVDCVAPVPVLEARVRARGQTDASEATPAVIAYQRDHAQSLSLDELRVTEHYDARRPRDEGHFARVAADVALRLAHPVAPALGRPHPGRRLPSYADKCACLARASSYPDEVADVTMIDTHRSSVFLAGARAYKLKKPLADARFDWRTLDGRGRNCVDELVHNRRFGDAVYVGAAALTFDGTSLALDGTGEACDWLVVMKRLPAERMLDQAIAAGTVDTAQLRAVVQTLCGVYATSPAAAPEDVAAWHARLAEGVEETARELADPRVEMPLAAFAPAIAAQRACLASAMFPARQGAGRIVDGHGDLRPEHICLGDEPRIIDGLEFSRALRTLDAADEMAFLALECERLGAPALARIVLDAYREISGDAPPDALLHFYASHRACVRAMLALRHLHDAGCRDPGRWRAQAHRYLTLAAEHARGFACPGTVPVGAAPPRPIVRPGPRA
jgi:aminoglycoside phosphotransferase family enzyme/predicted kinase